jgi:hypothetical protein
MSMETVINFECLYNTQFHTNLAVRYITEQVYLHVQDYMCVIM